MIEKNSHQLQTQSVDACPVCGSLERGTVITGVRDWFFNCIEGEWTFTECASCNSLYLDPRLTDACLPNAYSSYYTHKKISEKKSRPANAGLKKKLSNTAINAHFGTQLRPSFQFPIFDFLLKIFVNNRIKSRFRYFPKLQPNATILDVGCGSGKFLTQITDAGWEGFGVDSDPAAVLQAQKAGQNVLLGDIDIATSFNRRFSAITLSHVIEHVTDIPAVLRQSYTLLTNDGFLHLEYPNPQCDGPKRFGCYWRGLEAPRHLCLPSRTAIDSLLKREGYTKVEFLDKYQDENITNLASFEAAKKNNKKIEYKNTKSNKEPAFIRLFAWK